MNKELIGEHFVNLHDLSFEQAEKVLKIQRRNKKKKFGEIAVELGFLEFQKLDEYLEDPANPGGIAADSLTLRRDEPCVCPYAGERPK